MCREFTQVCQELELFGGELIAMDGSKFLAVNSRRRNFSTTKKLQKILEELDEQIATYLSELDEQDSQANGDSGQPCEPLPAKLVRLQARPARHETLQAQLVEQGELQISLTDRRDSRAMIYGNTTEVGDNVQTAVDSQHGLIVTHEVTNDLSDQAMLATMAVPAKEVLAIEALEVVADRGYDDGAQVKQCLQANIIPYVAKPLTSVNQNRGRYPQQDFPADAERDVDECPQGKA